jgi:hypothetical protein
MNYNISFSEMNRLAREAHSKKPKLSLEDAETSVYAKELQYLKSKETEAVLRFAEEEGLFYQEAINESDFISEGAEQRVYRLKESYVIKTNAGIFYEYWLDYFNSLLIHNYFFPSTAYAFLGFKRIGNDSMRWLNRSSWSLAKLLMLTSSDNF